ncbi:MAG: hypothetical protein Q7T96_08650 [Methylobacter sp.]|nr:hypothetical protein [Methylobacter sp.]
MVTGKTLLVKESVNARSIYWDICLAFIVPEAVIKAFKQAFYRIYPQVPVGSIV